jgi:uncharacterized protein (TIGR03118 family)
MFQTLVRTEFRQPTRRPTVPLCVVSTLLAIQLAACGGGGGSGYNAPTTNPPSSTPPTVTVNVQPTTITAGQNATLTWSNTGGLGNCTASGGWTGSQNASGTQSVAPTATTTYTLTCSSTGSSGGYGGGGSTSYSGMATLTVNGTPPPTASVFKSKLLVSNTAVGSATVDPHLVNAWGIVFAPGAPVWTANNGDGSGSSTLYDGNGALQGGPLVVTFGVAGGGTFHPTGIVFNGSGTDFEVTPAGGSPAPASFIYDGEDGMIAGWASGTVAVVAYTDMAATADKAVYKGLAIANNGSGNFLYATDFRHNKIDVFDKTFTKQTPSATSFTFTDPTLPTGYSAFGIQAIKGSDGTTQIYVAYAPSGDGHDNGAGKGMGVVDVYDTNGKFLKQLVPADTTNGKLNAPWGLALAPATGFGTFSSMLLVGNFGDGTVNAYDPGTGSFAGTLSDSTGAAITQNGLWGIAFGNDALSQPGTTLFYAAGPNAEAGGAYGRIDLGP